MSSAPKHTDGKPGGSNSADIQMIANAAAANNEYHLQPSKSSNNLYVVDDHEYNPLERHRPRGRESKDVNKGEGMTFLCCCLARPKVKEAAAKDHGMDRMYSMAAPSTTSK